MSQICEGVVFIEGRDDMIPDSHVYVIGKPDSKDLTMIDAGLMGKADYKLKSIMELGIELQDIKRVRFRKQVWLGMRLINLHLKR